MKYINWFNKCRIIIIYDNWFNKCRLIIKYVNWFGKLRYIICGKRILWDTFDKMTKGSCPYGKIQKL